MRAAAGHRQRVLPIAELRAARRGDDLAIAAHQMDARAAVIARRVPQIPADCASQQRRIHRHIPAELDIVRRQRPRRDIARRQVVDRKIIEIQDPAVDARGREIARRDVVRPQPRDRGVRHVEARRRDRTGDARPRARQLAVRVDLEFVLDGKPARAEVHARAAPKFIGRAVNAAFRDRPRPERRVGCRRDLPRQHRPRRLQRPGWEMQLLVA